MTDDTPSPEGPPPTPTSNELLGGEKLDVNALLQSFLKYIKAPKVFLDIIVAVFKSPSEFFGSAKDGDINHALGFYLVTLVYLAAFSILGSLFQGSILAVFIVIPTIVIMGAVVLVIASVVTWAIGKFIGKGSGSIVDGAKVVSFLYWIGLIGAFPLFVFLPLFLQTLISVACLVLWAYLLIPAVTTKFKTSVTTHSIVIWAIAGVFALFSLVGLLLGTGAKAVSNSYEEIVEDAGKQAEKLIAESKKQYEAQLEAAEQAVSAAAAEQASRQEPTSQPTVTQGSDPK